MTTRMRKLGIRTTVGVAVAAAPVAAACSSGPSYDDWAATDGAAGRINLDEVQTFKGAKSVSDFENRVNQIYEGDGLVLIRAEAPSKGRRALATSKIVSTRYMRETVSYSSAPNRPTRRLFLGVGRT